MAVGDAYGAKEWREGDGEAEVAYRTERIERRVLPRGRRVLVPPRSARAPRSSAGRSTPSPVYEGMLKEEMDAAAARHPEVPYEPQLIDATFARRSAPPATRS